MGKETNSAQAGSRSSGSTQKLHNMSHNSRPHASFKGSGDRREFETILFHRRRSKESAEKVEKDLERVSKQTDITISHEMRKILDIQAKLNNRIADLKRQQKIARWSSLPRIDEKSDMWCVDPYPVTFQTTRPVKLPDGGKTYPVRQRRKSLEFEDLPLLSYETRPVDSPMPSPAIDRKAPNNKPKSYPSHKPIQKSALTQPTEQDKPKPSATVSHNSSPQNSGSVQRRARPPVATSHSSIQQSSSPALRRAKPTSNSHTTLAPTSSAKMASDLPAKDNHTNSNTSDCLNVFPSLTNTLEVPPTQTSVADKFSRLDKRTILNSPLSKRKLNSILKDRESVIKPTGDVV